MKKFLLAAALAAAFGSAHAGIGKQPVDGSFEDRKQAFGHWRIDNAVNGWHMVSGAGIEPRNQVTGSASDLPAARADGSNQDGSPEPVVFAAPVPEPSTYALMCLGLGLIGVTLQRRRNAR